MYVVSSILSDTKRCRAFKALKYFFHSRKGEGFFLLLELKNRKKISLNIGQPNKMIIRLAGLGIMKKLRLQEVGRCKLSMLGFRNIKLDVM